MSGRRAGGGGGGGIGGGRRRVVCSDEMFQLKRRIDLIGRANWFYSPLYCIHLKVMIIIRLSSSLFCRTWPANCNRSVIDLITAVASKVTE